MKLEVLVTTMHQKDFSKYSEMNLQTDAVIANQADFNEWEETEINGKRVKFVTTNTRGLSKNRNIAISNINNADLIMFSDDDLKFYDGYEKIIVDEFKNHPEAEAIKFNINCISCKKLAMAEIKNFHPLNRMQVTSSGVCCLAIKRDVFLKLNIKFNERFGSGTENYCGEDTIFLQELLKKGLKLYASPVFVADIDQTDSTWFEGHNEKFFTVAGMIINEIYPLLSYLLVIRSAFKASRRKTSNLSFLQILKCYYRGIIKNIKEHKRNKI